MEPLVTFDKSNYVYRTARLVSSGSVLAGLKFPTGVTNRSARTALIAPKRAAIA